MRRREFIAGLGVAAAWPIAARAQQRTTPVVGILGSTRAEGYTSSMAAFMQGLKEAGFVPGQNVVLEQRWANDQYDQLPEMAADFVRAKVSLIAAIGNNLPTRAAKVATSTIPIVFTMGSNPVALGLVASLNRPGGNVTGVTTFAGELVQKRFQLLHDLVPNARRFGFLLNPDNPAILRMLTRRGLRCALGTAQSKWAMQGWRVSSMRLSQISRSDALRRSPFLPMLCSSPSVSDSFSRARLTRCQLCTFQWRP